MNLREKFFVGPFAKVTLPTVQTERDVELRTCVNLKCLDYLVKSQETTVCETCFQMLEDRTETMPQVGMFNLREYLHEVEVVGLRNDERVKLGNGYFEIIEAEFIHGHLLKPNQYFLLYKHHKKNERYTYNDTLGYMNLMDVNPKAEIAAFHVKHKLILDIIAMKIGKRNIDVQYGCLKYYS